MHGLNIAQQIAFLISHHFLFLPEFHFIRSHTGLCLHQKLRPHLGRIIEAIGSISSVPAHKSLSHSLYRMTLILQAHG